MVKSLRLILHSALNARVSNIVCIRPKFRQNHALLSIFSMLWR